jgi:hypothetical protein
MLSIPTRAALTRVLASAAGPGPQQTIDVQSGTRCGAFKTFGTWTVTL